MKGGTSIAVGVGIGYLLGRTRKMRFALGVAGAMMAKRSSDIPGELLERGTSLLKSSADLTQLTDTVRDELLGAARSAAVTAASNQLDSLNTRLQHGSSLLTGDLLSGNDRDRASDAEVEDAEFEDEDEAVRDAGEASPDDEPEDVDSGEEEEDRKPPAPRARKPAAKRARKTTSGTTARKSTERKSTERKPVSVSRRRSGSDSDEPPVRRTRR
ncbi:hypothetical protein B7C42_05526 [Nocardia cerradoensis]|uniref:DNA primase n=1 Tax=Nocardia cerradoensis TaxID=85688 RepID=A0A231H0G5_9NOCA|nr:hypothetical protein [Nocardia cerradoensis]OXR42327.1 hypothetical protein B7C42_05526 [Nocardia cerradoensis]